MSNAMNVPEEFKRFAQAFYQGSDREISTPQEWIAFALKHLDSKEKGIVKKFLTDLLNENHDAAELQRIWNNTPADYYIMGDGDLRGFLMTIRNMIE